MESVTTIVFFNLIQSISHSGNIQKWPTWVQNMEMCCEESKVFIHGFDPQEIIR